jgi:hypothetical protein
MANLGDIKLSADYEVLKQGPMDARLKKKTKNDLINRESWPADGDVIYTYQSMLVGIEDTGNVYVLKDKSKMFEPDFSGWQLLGSGGDGNGGGTSADVTEIEVLISKIQGQDTGYTNEDGLFITPSIRDIAQDEVNTAVSGLTETLESYKEEVDNYTINGKKVVENPVLETDDLQLSESYTTLNLQAVNLYPGDLITEALGKLEILLANTTLSVTAALNDLDKRIGKPAQFNEDGSIKVEPTGLFKRVTDLENSLPEIYSIQNDLNNLQQTVREIRDTINS